MESKKIIQKAIQGDLSFIIYYYYKDCLYSDELHCLEISTDIDTIETIYKIVPIKKGRLLKEIKEDKAKDIIKALSDWNTKQITNPN